MNGPVTDFACAYHICGSEDATTKDYNEDDEFPSPKVSLVCQYGRPYLGGSVPIYEIGQPCTACGGKTSDACIWKALCNNSVV
ncbi:hypothetical protein KIN20_036387 [Parelaphostrongylus tenuis]|uniref:Uncharacterized protein n=1 Tax=Parelaphostrongylus tenuis TaxID=148309 RepID=A0AAD5RCI3_PARTN|nr:hypothetical protein KIN20_036387 [Parelaphostrongylus tenuis]